MEDKFLKFSISIRKKVIEMRVGESSFRWANLVVSTVELIKKVVQLFPAFPICCSISSLKKD